MKEALIPTLNFNQSPINNKTKAIKPDLLDQNT